MKSKNWRWPLIITSTTIAKRNGQIIEAGKNSDPIIEVKNVREKIDQIIGIEKVERIMIK